jgi:UDP-N-acetylmuramoyl-L-alanyl-D-glutamate--2,6-diaminopimelate ligase
MSMPAEQLTTQPTLAALLSGLADAPACRVLGIASDSRTLAEGFLFLACAGSGSHGLDYLDDAINAGIAALAFDSTTATSAPRDVGVPVIPVAGLRRKLGEIANRFYGRPSEQIRVIGVTGTNGKTTVAWLIAQCQHLLGQRCGYAGTLGFGIDELEGVGGMTTPDVVELHHRLAGFRDQDASSAAIEISSHALAQNRIDGVRFDTALFTNLSRDHLDYHGDMRAYGEAKASLFLHCNPLHRIINLDSEFGTQLASRCDPDVLTVSTHFDRVANSRPYVFVRSVVAKETGSEISVRSSWGDGHLSLPLPGDFNVANAVIVLALLLNQGVEMQEACEVLSQVNAPPGRMQRVPASSAGPSVYVDYAHTPGALEAAIRALRPHCRGRLWCVFGCGGDRDRGKRPLMAKLAQRRADKVVITNDNPRSEEPASIITDIVSGLSNEDRATVIEDRAAAIAWTISNADSADVILIAGKGHENYQLIGDERRDFSDFGAASANLAARAKREEAGE